MKLFGKSGPAVVAFGTAMLALAGKDSVTAEEATAANGELEAAGIKGVQLITQAAYDELDGKASRTEAAENSVATYTNALKAAGAADLAALVAERDAYKVKADKFDKLPGAGHTTPSLEAGKTDVDAPEADADQKALDALPHNKALAGHPLFG